MRKLGHMVPYYTLMEGTMVTSPILAAIASFLVFAATAPRRRGSPPPPSLPLLPCLASSSPPSRTSRTPWWR